jgi:hypothetical protein
MPQRRGPARIGRPSHDLLKQTISYNLGVRIDYYALVNMRGFRDIMGRWPTEYQVTEPLLVGRGGPPTPRLYRDMSSYNTLWYARSRKNTTDYSGWRSVGKRSYGRHRPNSLKAAETHARPHDSLRPTSPETAAGDGDLALRVDKAEIMESPRPPLINRAYPDWGRLGERSTRRYRHQQTRREGPAGPKRLFAVATPIHRCIIAGSPSPGQRLNTPGDSFPFRPRQMQTQYCPSHQRRPVGLSDKWRSYTEHGESHVLTDARA